MNKINRSFVIEVLLCVWSVAIFFTWFTLDVYPIIKNKLPINIRIVMDKSYEQIYPLVWRDYIYSRK